MPFTYKLTIPVMYDPSTGTVISTSGSANDLHSIIVTDDLNATGADLTYLSYVAYWKSSGTPVPLTFSNVGGVLTFSNFPIIPAGQQIVIEITVVLNDTSTNVAGKVFTNTAAWSFGRLIDGTFYSPLPGQNGISQPMTIAEPNLVVNKASPETALNLGVMAPFTIDVQNTGGSDAWNVTILDQLPPFSTGAGMCQYDPRTALSARIVAADGTTLVRNLTLGTHYSLNYTGPPTCQLSLTMTRAGGPIAPGQHLIISYQTQLDASTTADNVALTNVAGATQWFSSDGTSPFRTYTKTLSDGTPAIIDYQDNYTLYTALAGYYFQKTVENRTSHESQATTAAAGDVLRYKLRLFNISEVINGITISDPLDPTKFDLTTFTMVTNLAALGATYSFNSTTGQFAINGNGAPLSLAPPAELVIEFDITLKSPLANGTAVINQATLSANTGTLTALSDDPYVNGVAPPGAPSDPTTVVIQAPGPLSKARIQPSATIGEQFKYRITVPADPTPVPLYDVRILDNLNSSAANMRFVSASVVSGGTWTLSNTSGSDTNLVIEDTVTGIDIPANGQAVIEITVELLNTSTNNSGLSFINAASYTYNRVNGDGTTQKPGAGGSTLIMTVVEPAVTAATKTVSNVTAGKLATDPAAVGDMLQYVVTIPNSGGSTAFDTNVVDTLPVNVSLVSGSATAQINGVAVTGFIVNPTTLPGGALAWGRQNGDGTLDIPAGQSLVLTYRVTVVSVNGLPFNNSVYVDWTSLDSTSTAERTGAGCPAITAPNDYCYGPVTATLSTVDTTAIAKSVVSDSWDSGLSTSTDSILRVGDTVVYRLALTLREGQLQNVVVTDTLPSGLAFDSVVSVNGDATAAYSASGVFSYADIPAANVPAPGQTGTITWTLGNITNAVDNNAANDTLVIEYRARVVKNTLAHTATTTLTNNVALSYTGSDPAAARLHGSASLTVLQPIMTTPTKSATGFTSPASVNVATDVMPFRLESCNATGLAPAYSVKFTDQLATQLNETTITTPVVRVGGTLLTAGSDYTYTPPAVRGGTMTFVLNTLVNPGQCATIDYSIGFYTDFGPNQTWTNSVALDEYWSLQVPTTTGQMYGPLGPTSFTMTNSTTITLPVKTLFLPASNEVTIGQEVVYRIAVPGTPTNGAIYNVVITDTLNAALQYMSASDVSGDGFALTDTSVAPSQVNLTIAQIPAGQQAIIELHARVANNASANAGVSFANFASYTYATSLGGAPISGGSDATDTPLRIVEPNVAVTKSVMPNTPPSAGAILTYTLTLTASGGANFSNAYDVSIVDSLSLGLAYVPNSATGVGTPVNPTITGDGVTTPQVLTWNTGFDIPEGTARVITYQVQVLSGVGPNQILRNDVRVAWTGLDGVNANERTGTGTPAYNDYFATAFTTLTTPMPGTLSKQNPATTTVTIGQPFTYRITVPATPMTTALHDVRILDNLSATGADLSFVSMTAVGGPYSWTPVNTGTATNLVIGDTTNGIDIPAGQQAVIDITVVPSDSPTNVSGLQFSNTASYTYNQTDNNPATQQPGGSATTGNLTIVGPDTLTLEKSGPADMNLGVPGTFTLNVHNAGTGTAWDVTVIDRLPNPTPGGMCDAAPTNVTAQLYLADGVTTVGSPLVAGSDFTINFTGAPSCTFTITMQSAAGAIPANNRLIITYQALLDADNVNGVLLTNVAGATQWYNVNPTPGVTPRTYTRVLTNGTVGTLDHEDAHSVNPLIPVNGIVYDSLSRRPIAGARVTMLRAGAELPASCFDDPAQQNQLTDAYGRYSFELNFSQSTCPPGENYVIAVTAAPAGYDTSAPSRIIPPTTSAATAPYSVPACPTDAIPATTDRCEAQDIPFAPTGAAATTYYLHLTLSNGQIPRDSQIFNNHIPVDPLLDTTIFIDKKSLLINAARGQMVPYTIAVKNRQGGVLQNMAIVDRLPPGFKYVEGSSRYDGNPVKPVIAGNGTELRWENLDLAYNVTHTIKLLLVVSSGVGEGEYVNRAWVHSNLTGEDSGIATATVRVTPDPTFDCTDIIGKVFDDANANGYPDRDEKGLGGVRIVSARGLIATTDKYGRFHITCAAVPNEDRGSNFILKLDDRTLPAGYRVTTENPLVHRLTRGKAMKFNFGATLHRVVRLDIADGVFEPRSTEMRPQWKPRIEMLLSELRKAPAIFRISYLADVEDQAVVKARTEAVKREIANRWKQGSYELTIETEIFWRRGGPPARRTTVDSAEAMTETTTAAVSAPPVASETRVSEAPTLGQAVEKQAGTDELRTLWVRDGDADDKQGDKVEVKKVPEKAVKTVKLQNLVPPIHFASGEAEIPEGYVQRLRDVLDSMKGRNNVRLHFVGHTDNAQLFREVKQKYGDNLTLSRERAGVAAEYFQKALHLPPESITYEGMGESQPVASNAIEQGKVLNRRVEVEVWYDEITDQLVDREVVVAGQMNRVKVCRVETVCKMRYKEGNSKRARIKNLVEPLHFDDDMTAIPEEFVQKVRQALTNLGTKEHVVVKFIGYTDNLSLLGRNERIYGNAVALSKARARRTALAIQDALKLPTSGIDVDGKGAANPIASNDTEKGQALNRRIEVEFWYDDALQELSDEPQLCPEAAGAETVTRVYDSPSGGVKPILFEQGKPVITSDQLERLRSSMDEIRDKAKVRLRFIGYTNDERLERRTAMVYNDDIGLSTARARRAMNAVKEQLGLKDEQVEFEGRGYVQSDDVVNTGFVESDTARVEVQVVYDELLAIDDTEGMDITRFTREVTPKDPLALNLMRITVDGKPIDDPNKSIADIERCTDVALDRANVQFKFDNLDLKPRLNATAWPNSIRYQDDPNTEYPENLMRFRTYANYAGFIKKSEIRIFDEHESVNDTPFAVIEVNKDGRAEWQPTFPDYKAPGRELKYVLRVYDADNHFDETKPLLIWIVDRQAAEIQDHDVEKELLVGYGKNLLAADNIPKKGGTVKVYGSAVPADHSVFVAGRAVPVGKEGKFVTEEILPSGMHTVEVAILDKSGNGDLFLRDLDLKKNDWFYVGIADVTVARDSTTGPAKLVTNDQTHYNNELSYDGRLAFYTKGKFGEGWELTSSADSLEGPVKDIFSNLGDKSPDALFRRIDPQYFYPTYGDDGSVEEGAPTLGKFYLKMKKDESYGLWGNFKIGYNDNDLAHVDRGLYGANAHYQTLSMTSFGEKRFMIDGFAAQPGTVGTRDEFLGAGGSLYYLRHQDILSGSERVRIEVRDKDSGIVTAVKNLTPTLDYAVDYLQGRISLSQPLSPTASDNLLVTSDTVGGNPVYLVVRYEYEPSSGDTNSMSLGGRTHVWLNDYVKLGVTSSKDRDSENPNGLDAADLTLRKSAVSWIKVETSQSKGPGLTSLSSSDGGFTFGSTETPLVGSAGAYRVDTSIGFRDIIDGANGQLTLYTQSLDAGYSAPGLATATDTKQYGGTLKAPVTDRINVTAKADKTSRQQGLETSASEVDVNYLLTEHWTLSPGVRRDSREDHSTVVPLTQMQGDRTDAALRATYDSRERWTVYGFAQDTVSKTGNREENDRVGSGGAYRITDRFKVNGEVSTGDLGGAGKVGTEYLYSDRTNMYLNYVYDNETPDNGIRSNKGNMIAGVKTRYSATTSVYAEEKYTHGDVPTGLTHSAGVDLAPFDHWNVGANVDFGTLRDPITAARLERKAASVRVGYGADGFTWTTAFEYRVDKTEDPTTLSVSDRDSWLIKNSFKYQLDPASRLLGKLNHAESKSSLGSFYDGTYTEAVLGYGYRPVTNDRLNTLFKYTYFYNLPSPGQVTDTVTSTATNTATDFVQKSHIFSLDVVYDLTQRWTIGGKYAYRLGQISEDRVTQKFFDSRAHLYVLRVDWHFVHKWDALIEGRVLDLPDAQDRLSGALLGVYRHLGNNIKLGVGYNFSKFSDDLTQLDYKHQGLFINLIGKY